MKALLVVLMLILVGIIPAHAVEAHWDFGDPTNDGAIGYTLRWGTAAGNYTKTQEILKSACVAGTDVSGPYNCKMNLADTEFVVGTRYYFSLKAYAYSSDGTTRLESSEALAQYVNNGSGGNTGVAPKNPTGLGIYPVPH